MEEECAVVYKEYLKNLPQGQEPKPVVGFVAGLSTEKGLMYGHAGAIWRDDTETAASKKKCWKDAGFVVAETLEDVGGLIMKEAKRIGAA